MVSRPRGSKLRSKSMVTLPHVSKRGGDPFPPLLAGPSSSPTNGTSKSAPRSPPASALPATPSWPTPSFSGVPGSRIRLLIDDGRLQSLQFPCLWPVHHHFQSRCYEPIPNCCGARAAAVADLSSINVACSRSLPCPLCCTSPPCRFFPSSFSFLFGLNQTTGATTLCCSDGFSLYPSFFF